MDAGEYARTAKMWFETKARIRILALNREKLHRPAAGTLSILG